MADGLTRTAQQTEVGEGLAVGCLVVGVSAVTTEQGPLDDAFAGAIASWAWAVRYPAVAAMRRPALGPLLSASARRRNSRIAQWAAYGGLYTPQLRDDDWDLASACAAIEERTAIPARQWTSLAATFVGNLAGELVRRHPPTTPTDSDLGTLDLG